MDEMAWVAETAVASMAQNFDPDGRIVFDDGPFSGFIERIPVRPGIALYRVEGVSSHAWRLTAQGDAPAGNLVFGAMLDGAGAIEAKGNARQNWKGGGRSFVLSLAEREITYHIEAGKQWRAVTLLLEPAALDALAEQNGLPPLVRAALDDGQLPILHMFELNRAVMRAAHDLLQPPYRGNMAMLWRESKVLELLTHQFDHLAESPASPPPITPRDLARVREAHDLLMADLRTPPSLDELAALVRLAPRRLNQGFRHVYGMTVFEALLDARMKTAHKMICEKRDIPLKHLAWMVGYNQLSNFISAYRRRFGVPPGQHRRESEAS